MDPLAYSFDPLTYSFIAFYGSCAAFWWVIYMLKRSKRGPKMTPISIKTPISINRAVGIAHGMASLYVKYAVDEPNAKLRQTVYDEAYDRNMQLLIKHEALLDEKANLSRTVRALESVVKEKDAQKSRPSWEVIQLLRRLYDLAFIDLRETPQSTVVLEAIKEIESHYNTKVGKEINND